jgi:hypothetical protein
MRGAQPALNKVLTPGMLFRLTYGSDADFGRKMTLIGISLIICAWLMLRSMA